MEDPARTEWRLSLLLFFLGCAALLASMVIGTQAAGAPSQFAEFDARLLAIPAWGAVAVALGLRVRKGSTSNFAYFIAVGWLAVGMLVLYSTQFAIV